MAFFVFILYYFYYYNFIKKCDAGSMRKEFGREKKSYQVGGKSQGIFSNFEEILSDLLFLLFCVTKSK